MSEALEHQPSGPEASGSRDVASARRPRWQRPVLLAGALVSGLGLGAGGFAYAATVTGHVVWGAGHRLEHIQRMVHGALDSVGATTVQEDKVHDIIATGFGSMTEDGPDRMAMRKQVLDLLRAPTIDRAAVEKLRAEQVAKFDAKSKTIVGMVLDSADQLTPDQRAALADRAEAMMARGMGPWHREGRDDGGNMEGGMHRHGPEDQDHADPDHGADRNPG
ncbi:Spy/CpxP family protein refolding chaperone [Lichenifustis flavocetrariae]|uniref:Spy/CpxP family protein refolding chaperone n=1 Tax=Lichenifustis flavocetrariae TaxID=2949735 RepID=A0AA42CJ77_9HYPH|nr:Spy/CpxP family protein refolding chaperone [Lichenifustis flavocetrariae]MCW6509154.1 Spy/CpxP family protein refolding chaperone [Lichenifustis flavocetrariae]